MEASEHDLVALGYRVSCTRCGGSSKRNPLLLRRWLATPCGADRARANQHGIPISHLEIRGRHAHSSHALMRSGFSGVCWCTVCSATAKHQLRDLAEACPQRDTKAGAQNKARLSKGLAPGASTAAASHNRHAFMSHGGKRVAEGRRKPLPRHPKRDF